MYSFFELYQATEWAIDVFKHTNDNINIYLNVKNVDKTSRWFLCHTLDISQETDDFIIYSRNINNIEIKKIFEDNNSLYVGLYNENGHI
jgi:hypothetical protein